MIFGMATHETSGSQSTRIIELSDGLEVAWTAVDGHDAVAKTAADRPDLILMDLVMPE